MSAGETSAPPPDAPPGEEIPAITNTNGTAQQVAFNDLLKLTNEAIKLVTAINVRTKHQPEALSTLNSLKDSLCTYAAERVTTVEEKIEGIHAAIAKTDVTLEKTEKSWAQIVASGTTATTTKARPTVGPEQIKQREQAKREREQYELTLNANAASDEIKIHLDQEHARNLKAQFQKAIDDAAIPVKPKVVSINKLPKCTIRLQFKTPEQAEEARKAPINWDIAYEGLKAHKPIYGIVVHGVKSDAINLEVDHSEIIKEWEEENSDRGIKITKIATLRRTAKHRPTSHHSLKIYTEDKDAANKCIQRGFIIDSTKHKVERYVPQWHLIQCFKCHGHGHHATACKRSAKCGNCSKEDHVTANCTAAKSHCANCTNGEHPAWDKKCPVRIKENKRLADIRSDPSTTYFQ